MLVLPLIAQGAVGLIGVTTHLAGQKYAALIDAALAGRRQEAIALNRELIAVADAVMNTSQGAIVAKAGLRNVSGSSEQRTTVRLPLVEHTGTPRRSCVPGLAASELA